MRCTHGSYSELLTKFHIFRVVLKVEKKWFQLIEFGLIRCGPLRDLGVKHPSREKTMDMLALSTKSLEWESLFAFFV